MIKLLKSEAILPTIKTLHERVHERFPKRSLSNVCSDLYETAQDAQAQVQEISNPNVILRIGIGLLVALIITISLTGFLGMKISINDFDFIEVLTIIETAINDIIFIAAGIFFLVSIETRIKRKKSLAKLNELRSLAHIIDMHQLTKEPERILKRGNKTKSSPKGELSAFELTRYLDYCSEMLSLIGKVAVLYVQNFDDPIVLASVTEIENLTTGLSQKIWQKIMIIHQLEERLLSNKTS